MNHMHIALWLPATMVLEGILLFLALLYAWLELGPERPNQREMGETCFFCIAGFSCLLLALEEMRGGNPPLGTLLFILSILGFLLSLRHPLNRLRRG